MDTRHIFGTTLNKHENKFLDPIYLHGKNLKNPFWYTRIAVCKFKSIKIIENHRNLL